MKSDFYTAIAQIAAERGIPREAVLASVEHALKTVYRTMSNTREEVDRVLKHLPGIVQKLRAITPLWPENRPVYRAV